MRKFHILLLVVFFSVLIWSFINPNDYFTWVLEVFPGIIGFLFIVKYYKRFQFTDIAYIMIVIHCSILFIGGHWSYAENPWFESIKNFFGLDRNYYDRLGHFMQGFVPALLIREILQRNNVVKSSKWLITFIITFCLSITAVYELIEFATSLILGQSADQFLGSQGDIWDAQWDMTLATTGAVAYLIFVYPFHGNIIKKLENHK